MRAARWRRGAPLLIEQVGQPEAARFVWHKLRQHDLSALEWFKLLPLHGRYLLRGLCRYPLPLAPRNAELRHGYRITASANVLPSLYPHECPLPIGTVRREKVSRRSGRRATWSYVLEHVTFVDTAETLVFVAGHEAFHYLRHSRQIEGRNTEPGANRYGLEWLYEWRGEARRRRPHSRARREKAGRQLLLPFHD